jgi:hypothetical protein
MSDRFAREAESRKGARFSIDGGSVGAGRDGAAPVTLISGLVQSHRRNGCCKGERKGPRSRVAIARREH